MYRNRLWLSSLALLLALSPVLRSAAMPRPEHPRPDRQRDSWLNLNGEWQFENDEQATGLSRGLTSGKDLTGRINVPFAPESKLSGIGTANNIYYKNLWYRRLFEVPAAMKGQRILLHFGAVDYRAWVWVNGHFVGSHTGESPAFAFEITRALQAGQNELVVRVFDDLRSGLQPGGKQARNQSAGVSYTRTTGIWQTVWLEGVGSTYIQDFSLVPDPDNSRALLSVTLDGSDRGLKIVAEAMAGGRKVGEASAPAQWIDNRLVLNLSEKKLWMPASPFLYDLKLTLYKGTQRIDSLSSYFGLRKVTIEGRAILINGKRIFQRTILDQGFYPDGVWTAPSDAELKADIERSMACGFNGARLHQKVFEPRFLYWADKLGYLVWGEFPNWNLDYARTEAYAPFLNEWIEVLTRDRNHPAIIGWCPFNETPQTAGELQQMIWNATRRIDPTRPIIESSGYAHTVVSPQTLDMHDYSQDPAAFKTRWESFFKPVTGLQVPLRYRGNEPEDAGVPFMVSEFGGTGWERPDAPRGGAYGRNPVSLEEFYQRYQGLVDALLDNPDMFGFCYTQLTDVEQEHNGLYYYERAPKFDVKRLHAITSREAAYEKTGPVTPRPEISEKEWRVLAGARPDGELAKPYRYTSSEPASGWMTPEFDDGAWQTFQAPAGQRGAALAQPAQAAAAELFLRRTFEYQGGAWKEAALVITHTGAVEVFVNGVKIWNGEVAPGSRGGAYRILEVSEALRQALKEGRNAVAIHLSGGGRSADLALLVR